MGIGRQRWCVQRTFLYVLVRRVRIGRGRGGSRRDLHARPGSVQLALEARSGPLCMLLQRGRAAYSCPEIRKQHVDPSGELAAHGAALVVKERLPERAVVVTFGGPAG